MRGRGSEQRLHVHGTRFEGLSCHKWHKYSILTGQPKYLLKQHSFPSLSLSLGASLPSLIMQHKRNIITMCDLRKNFHFYARAENEIKSFFIFMPSQDKVYASSGFGLQLKSAHIWRI